MTTTERAYDSKVLAVVGRVGAVVTPAIVLASIFYIYDLLQQHDRDILVLQERYETVREANNQYREAIASMLVRMSTAESTGAALSVKLDGLSQTAARIERTLDDIRRDNGRDRHPPAGYP